MSKSFDLEVCRRLPLAEAVVRLLDFALADELLDDVFARLRARSYEGEIRFPQFAQLLADGLFARQRSVHETFQRAIDEGQVTVTVPALYGTLRRMPLAVSLGLFDAACAQLRTVLPTPPASVAHPLPASLEPFWALSFDGKKLKHVAHRLKPLRGLKGNIFGGKLLVVQDMASAQAVALEAVADGETADNPLVPGCVARVRALPTAKPRLWVADRAFCEYKTLPLLAAEGDHFVVRYIASCKFQPDGDVPARTGIDTDGRSYRDERGWLGTGKVGRVHCRKITVTRPGDQDFAVVTNLEDCERYPANDLLGLYHRRWGIETMFQQVVQTFDLRHLMGGMPRATVFQAALCFLVYNITLMIRDFVAAAAAQEAAKVSTKTLFSDVADELRGMLKMFDDLSTLNLLRAQAPSDPSALRRHLQRILANVWCNRWRKAPTRKQPAQRKFRAYLCGGHSSVDKILRGVHHEIVLHNLPKDCKPHEAKKDV